MLRPLPDKSNREALAKLGWLAAIRSARLDALHELRDCTTHLQSNITQEAIDSARAALDRLEQLNAVENSDE